MQEEYIINKNDNNQKQRPRRIFIAIICVFFGLVAGIGGTTFYFYSQVETELTENAVNQGDIELKLNELINEVDSLDSEVDDLIYAEATDSQVIVVETSSYSENIQNIAERVMPSVVGVRTVSIQEAESYFMGDEGSQEVVGVGTGVIVSEDGLILTNQHVVSDNPQSITVTLMDGNEYDAEVIYADESMDLAVIRIEATGLTAATLGDSDEVNVGEVTIAIGNPLGLEYERSVTAGIVSALDRSIQLDNYSFATNLIQTDAAINSGNSGGPLLNSSGEVIGINTYKMFDGEGMGFAVPINAAIPIIEQVIETGEFIQSLIGISAIDTNVFNLLSDEDITQMGMNDIEFDDGLLILSVDETSDAYTSGLQIYDIILEADGTEIDSLLELRTEIYSYIPGESIKLTILRNGETLEFSIILSEA